MNSVLPLLEKLQCLSQAERAAVAKWAKLAPRCIALAVITNEKKQLLVAPGGDASKGEWFYRPLGGGTEFGERAAEALERELREESGLAFEVGRFLGTVENLFSFEGSQHHEIALVYRASLADGGAHPAGIPFEDSGQASGLAVWRGISEIHQEGARLYPEGLSSLLGDL